MRRKIRSFAVILSLTMIVSLLAGCGGKTGTSDKKGTTGTASKEIIIAMSDENKSFDLCSTPNITTALQNMYEPLVVLNAERTALVPGAAESVNVSEDGKTITIKLPKGLTFTNGNPITAQAVKASYERFRKLNEVASMVEILSSIETPDEQTVVLKFSENPASILVMVASTLFGVVDVSEATKIGDSAFMSKPVGYGPTYLKEWVKGSHVTLVKNPDFKTNNPRSTSKGPINFDTIKIRFIPNNFTRVSELIEGNIDVMVNVPLESLETLKNNKDITVKKIEGNMLNLLTVNQDKITDVKVRYALELAINREELKTAFNGNVDPIYGPYQYTWLGYSKDAEEKYKTENGYKLDKAKALLAEAGYKDINGDGIVEKDGKPLSLEICYANGDPKGKTIAPVLQSQYKAIGVQINLKETDGAGISEIMQKRSYDILALDLGWADASIIQFAVDALKLMDKNPNTDQFNKIIAEAASTTDIPKRITLYEQAGKLLYDYHTMVSLFAPNDYVAYRNNIKNLYLQDGGVWFYNATKE